MALMVCPDCGAKISDTAEMCISCGCDLYLYREELRIDKEIEEKVIVYSEKMDLKKPPKQINSLSEIHMYRNTDNANALIMVIALGCIIASLFCFVSGEDLFICILPAIVGVIALIGYYFAHRDAKNLLKKEQKRIQQEIDNFEKAKTANIIFYRQALLREKQDQLEKIRNRNMQTASDRPKTKGLSCPACDSTSYEKITTLNRIVSVELVGLASSKIGKQYKCKKCGHLW